MSVPWTALTGYPLIGNNLAASDDLQTLIVAGMEEGVYRARAHRRGPARLSVHVVMIRSCA